MMAAIAIGAGATANAQNVESDYYNYPHMFVGVQGGVQNTLTKGYNHWNTFTPTGSVSFGGFFDEVFGARLHVNGAWSKACTSTLVNGLEKHFNYNYVTTDADVLVNLCNLIGKKDSYPVNLIFVGGLGYNYAWHNKEAMNLAYNQPICINRYSENDHRGSINGRVGLMLDIPVHKNVSVTLEGDVDRFFAFDSKKFVGDKLQVLAQVGMNFKFGYKKKIKTEPTTDDYVDVSNTTSTASSTPVKPAASETKKPAPAPAPAPKADTKRVEIFYALRGTEVSSSDVQKLAEVAEWLKANPNAKVTVTGYADKGTGTAAINKKYAQSRANEVTRILKKNGIAADRITTDSKGDTEQPFSENDKNRVTIVVGK